MIGGVRAVAGKEFRAFFLTPIGYVILVVFTLLAGWWVFHPGRFFETGEADLRVLFQFFPWAFLLFGPAVTMRLWAEEKKQNTFEVLMTTPLGAGAVVVGKFLAAVGAVAVWLLCLLPIVGVVCWVGDPDPGPLWGGMLSALLLGACYASIGLMMSATTENQIIALIGAFAVALGFFLLSQPFVGELFPGAVGSFLHQLSLEPHFRSVQRGVVDLRDLVYALSFIAFFLYWNAWWVSRRRGSPWNVFLVAGIAVLANAFVRHDIVRVDLTEDGRFRLSEVSREILEEQVQGPLKVSAYFSSDLPAVLLPRQGYARDLLTELQALDAAPLQVEFRDPAEDEAAAADARRLGLSELPRLPGSEGGPIFLGLHLEYFDQEAVLRLVGPPEKFEDEMMVRIDRISRPHPLTVAFQVNELRPARDLQGRSRVRRDRHSPERDYTILRQQVAERFDTTLEDLLQPVPDDVRCLVVANAAGMDPVQKFWFDQYVMRGGHVVLLMEGTESARIGDRGPGANEVRQPLESQVDDVLSNWGIVVDRNVVLDASCGLQRGRPYPPAVRILDESIAEHPLTRGVRQMYLPAPSSLVLDPKPGVRVEELVHSSRRATSLFGDLLVLDDTLPDPRAEAEEYRYRYLLAALLEGSFHSLYTVLGVPATLEGVSAREQSPPDTRILVVGSSDFAADPQVQEVYGSLGITNLELIVNAIGAFTSDRDFAGLRSKRLTSRPFAEPSTSTRLLGLFLGVYLMPLLLLGTAFLVYWWRRVWRPEQVRARRAAGREGQA